MATPVVYVPTQTCTHCKAEKSLDDFYRQAKKRNGRSSWCKACSNNRSSDWHGENRDKVNANWMRSWEKAKGLIMLMKERGSCAMCSEDHPVCLDFHHVDPSQKEVGIAKCHSIKTIVSESAKCVLLCRNCHSKAHAQVIDVSHLEPMTAEYINKLVAEYALKLLVSGE
jgi:hypothetical protein